jgi:hypothetical protein
MFYTKNRIQYKQQASEPSGISKSYIACSISIQFPEVFDLPFLLKEQ